VDPEFEWDAGKAERNVRKHGIAFEEALTVFADPLARIFDDPDHSSEERRELIIGHSAKGRVLIVSFAELGPRTRIISARKVTKRERHDYEENTKEG
jgi:uncharacterized DUF497 family protein